MGTTIYPKQAASERLQAMNSGTAVVFTAGTFSSSSPNVTSVAPSPVGLVLAGDTLYLPTASGTMMTATVLSVTSTTITLTGNAPATVTATGFIVARTPPCSLQGRNLRLFASSYSPNFNTVLSDLTAIEATFTGYAAIAVSLTYGILEGTVWVTQSQLLRWIASDAVTPNTIYGWWIDDGTDVQAVGLFDSPVPMALAGEILAGVLEDSFPSGSSFELLPA